MFDIFISYARADRELVAPLAGALEQLDWSVWWDRQIPPGKTFDEVIEEALDESSAVVCVWTPEGVASRWVRTEAAEGAARGVLVPVLLREVRVPLAFRRIQAADLTDWEPGKDHEGFHELVEALRHILDAARDESQEAQPDQAVGALSVARSRAAAGDWTGVLSVIQALDPETQLAPESRQELDALAEQAKRSQQSYDLFEEAEVLYAGAEWGAVVAKIDDLRAIDPTSDIGSDLRRRAEKHLAEDREARLSALHGRATEALRAREWNVAVARLEELATEAPVYKDSAELMKAARAGADSADRYRALKAMSDEGLWTDLLSGAETLKLENPAFGDPDDLITLARSRLDSSPTGRSTAADEVARPGSDDETKPDAIGGQRKLWAEIEARIPAVAIGSGVVASAYLTWVNARVGMVNAVNIDAFFLLNHDRLRSGAIQLGFVLVMLGLVIGFAGGAARFARVRRTAGVAVVVVVVLYFVAGVRSDLHGWELVLSIGPFLALACGLASVRRTLPGRRSVQHAVADPVTKRLAYGIGAVASTALIVGLVLPSWKYSDYNAFSATGLAGFGIGDPEFDEVPILFSLGSFTVAALVAVAVAAFRRDGLLAWLPTGGMIAVWFIGGFMLKVAGTSGYRGYGTLERLTDELGGAPWLALFGATLLAVSLPLATLVARRAKGATENPTQSVSSSP